MKKGLTVFAICLLALAMVASVAFASATRVATMGDVGNIVKDGSNIWTLPQTITMYPNRLMGNISAENGLCSIGGNYAVGPGVLGMYFKDTDLSSTFAPGVPNPAGNVAATYDQKIDLFYGWDMNGMPLGAQLSFYGNSHEMDASADKSVESVTGFELRFGATFADNLETFFGFSTVSWTNENANGDMVTEPNGNTDIEFGARYWHEASNSYSLIPYIGFAMVGEGYKDAADNEVTDSGMILNIGVGNNMYIDDNIMAVADVGFMYGSFTTEVTAGGSSVENGYGNTYPYFKIGLEAEVTSWMDFRMGAHKSWNGLFVESNNGDDTENWGYAETDLYVGTAFHFGNLDIDAQVDPNFLTRGPNFISGQSGDMASRISLCYTW
ncbi:MAG: hypothetical protein P9M15_06925 [Candidatus Electryoneaceae bacterium]|nr:hypothetical protein [Candidatus Electryoneaceae bacterium]